MAASALYAAATRAQNSQYVKSLPASSGTTKGDTSSFLDKFWAKVYSYQTPSLVADKIIQTGDTVAKTRDAVINEAKTGVKLGLTFGPLIIVLLAALYLWMTFGPRR